MLDSTTAKTDIPGASQTLHSLRAAAAILEWQNIAPSIDGVVHLAVRSFDATVCDGEGGTYFNLGSVTIHSTEGATEAVTGWCSFVLQAYLGHGAAGLPLFIEAFQHCRPEQLVIVTQTCARIGLGSHVDPVQAGSGTSHLHEVSMFGVVGRGETLNSATMDWLTAAAAHAQRAWTALEAAA